MLNQSHESESVEGVRVRRAEVVSRCVLNRSPSSVRLGCTRHFGASEAPSLDEARLQVQTINAFGRHIGVHAARKGTQRMAEAHLRHRLLHGGPAGADADSQLTEASSGTSTPSSASTRSSMLAVAATPSSQAPVNLTSLFLLLLLLRVANAALTRTFFQPDEYWQSLEIAHSAVWGWGYRTWEWRLNFVNAASASSWSDGPVRSFAHPALFVPLYWVLKVLRLDGTFLMVSEPTLSRGFKVDTHHSCSADSCTTTAPGYLCSGRGSLHLQTCAAHPRAPRSLGNGERSS